MKILSYAFVSPTRLIVFFTVEKLVSFIRMLLLVVNLDPCLNGVLFRTITEKTTTNHNAESIVCLVPSTTKLLCPRLRENCGKGWKDLQEPEN